MKAATLPAIANLNNTGISIHAAREGGDGFGDVWVRIPIPISIHAAREGGDEKLYCRKTDRVYFNPRRP